MKKIKEKHQQRETFERQRQAIEQKEDPTCQFRSCSVENYPPNPPSQESYNTFEKEIKSEEPRERPSDIWKALMIYSRQKLPDGLKLSESIDTLGKFTSRLKECPVILLYINFYLSDSQKNLFFDYCAKGRKKYDEITKDFLIEKMKSFTSTLKNEMISGIFLYFFFDWFNFNVLRGC